MKLPAFGACRRYTATVPALDGGVDRSRGIAHLADNAVWEAENLWWQQGMLRPRPAFCTDGKWKNHLSGDAVVRPYTDGNERPVALTHSDGNLVLYVYNADGSRFTSLSVLEGAQTTQAFCVPAGGEKAQFYTLLTFAEGRIFGIDPADHTCVELTGAAYVPLRLTDATPNSAINERFRSGTVYEGANRLTPWFRSEFRSDGVGTHYRLPCGNITGTFTMWWSDSSGYHYFELQDGEEVSAVDKGYKLYLERRTGWFWVWGDNGAEVLEASVGSNIHVTACATVSAQEKAMVFGAQTACWFGGKRSGVAGGTRLFLGNGSTLLWSALENPLYFPVENTVQVGMPAQTITALRGQADRLVVFKERELYSVEYETVTNGTTLTETAAFPITPLHGAIGCDLPDTVALRGNRLTWACKDGAVYTLSALGTLTQPSVTCLSAPIAPLLRQRAPAPAAAAMWDGRYWLLWGDRLFVLEAGTDPVWYTFTVPQTGAQCIGILQVGNGVLIPALFPRETGENAFFWFTAEGEQDCCLAWENEQIAVSHRPIPVTFCTKAYDIGEADTYKQVLQVAAGITAAGQVTPTYVTERGEWAGRPVYPADDGLLRLSPILSRCRRFALKLTGENMCVDGIAVHLRGGMR